MGTNYYLKIPGKPPCEHCGRGDPVEELHIGKSSIGWCFSLHVIPERGINDLDDWVPLFERGEIRDEYGVAMSVPAMIGMIAERSAGLARHVLGVDRCVKHGAGTWDCIEGWFS